MGTKKSELLPRLSHRGSRKELGRGEESPPDQDVTVGYWYAESSESSVDPGVDRDIAAVALLRLHDPGSPLVPTGTSGADEPQSGWYTGCEISTNGAQRGASQHDEAPKEARRSPIEMGH